MASSSKRGRTEDSKQRKVESNPQYRPRSAQSVNHLPQAEKWYQTVLTEISTTLTRLMDPATTDANLRVLNDRMNQLFKDKRTWEFQIRKLGGHDYITYGNRGVDQSTPQVDGYRYFGRAQELPDVKPMLQKKAVGRDDKRVSRISGSYYGRDDAPSAITPTEIAEINKVLVEHGECTPVNHETLTTHMPRLTEYETERSRDFAKSEGVSDLPRLESLPSQATVTKYLVERRKEELIKRLQT
ncbi:pre-mRNA-splicing factor Isy1p [Diutina catenulata]